MAFWKEQPTKPVAGAFDSVWDGRDFCVLYGSTVILRLRGSDGAVLAAIPSGAITEDMLAGVTSASIAEDVIQVAEVTLTNAEIKALNATPKELVAAPGAGKFIEFVGAVLYHDYGSEVLDGNHALTIGLDDGTVAVAATIAHGDFAHKAADHVYAVKSAVAVNDTAANALNKNLALAGAGDYGGNASNDTVWTIKVAYRVHDFS
jgi:hypothetical protein